MPFGYNLNERKRNGWMGVGMLRKKLDLVKIRHNTKMKTRPKLSA